MFALALWDRRERALSLTRDQAGEKPLYFGWQGKGGLRALLFGSELKALAPHPSFEDDIDRAALAEFMRYGYVLAPRSIYRGISKLEPGTFMTISSEGREERRTYWSARSVAETGIAERRAMATDEAVAGLEQRLSAAVGRQMISDVPLGAFLSGGVDSSTIVALMQQQSARPVKTFTIGFEEERFNESVCAAAVAKHLGTDHTEIYLSSSDALAVISSLPRMYDEPFADSSQIPTHLVSKVARSEVTVALSGDGGDELFGGYGSYPIAQRFWGAMRHVPLPFRRAAGLALDKTPAGWWNAVGRFLPAGRASTPLSTRVRRGAGLLGAANPAEACRSVLAR